MSQSTRQQLLHTARRLFAERGFDGVSIAAIAEEQVLTKQALLHHFKSKEKLYGEILEAIARELHAERVAAQAASPDPVERLERALVGMLPQTAAALERARLLMRELLDNRERARHAEAWYLRDYLDELMAMVRAVPGWASATDAEVLALVYQHLGAINYYAISVTTLREMYGAAAFANLSERYPQQLASTLRQALAARPDAGDTV